MSIFRGTVVGAALVSLAGTLPARSSIATDAVGVGVARLASALAAPPAARRRVDTSGARRMPPASWAREDPADSLYRLARRALADESYRRAAMLFGEITERYPKSEYAGDALYWRAFALRRLGAARDLDSALAAIARQASAYPSAGTRRDAADLRTQLLAEKARRGDPGAAQQIAERAGELQTERGCPSEDDDMRLAALQGLMQMDAESALPILRQVLARRGACTERLRKQAVFIASQKHGDEATTLLLEAARNDPSADVRGDAIQWLGQARSERAAAALDSILDTSRDSDIQEKAIFALSQVHDARAVQALRRFAEDEKRPAEARAKAVFWLGQGNRSPENLQFLRGLFGRTSNEDIRNNILQSVAQDRSPEASKWLLDVARDRAVPMESRKQAVFWMSQHAGGDVRSMAALYDEMRGESEMRNQIIFALSQRREPEATDKLMEIASKEPDRELRKQAIFWLGQRKDPRVARFLLELINR